MNSETVTETLSNGNQITYRPVDGTYYHAETPAQIVRILERAKLNHTRIILDYGDSETGRSWGEIHDITGYIGRSTGRIKIPLLIYNSRSHGGGGILDHCIVRILTSRGKETLYQHPTYTPALNNETTEARQ